MKQTILFICLCTMHSFVQAQTKQGTIILECKLDNWRHMKDDNQMKAMVPQFQTSQKELIFKENISLYKNIEKAQRPDPFDDNGNRIMIRIGGPGENNILYKDYARQKITEQTDLAGKTYLISDSIKILSWKLGEETKNIIGHTCKKASAKSPLGNDVTAWYAEDIAAPVGPENYGGLPGAILLLDVNNGDIVFTATVFNDDIGELKEPAKGKRITRADFEKKMDEIFGPASPDGRRMMRRNN
ncbi:GLPGLI family protein [Parafilimonas sp.]|uniref:GLPGLI family protein n=1 Tax=Parafilimonas sp. TaxID=1969739 RepID=UPI003F7FFE42